MGRRRVVRILLWLMALALTLNAARLLWPRWQANAGFSRALASITPYTVTMQNKRTGLRQTNSLRADGSFVINVHRFEGPDAMSQRTIYLATAQVIEADDVSERKSTTVVSPEGIRLLRERDPSSGCLKTFGGAVLRNGERLAREETMAGRSVLLLISGSTRTWVAPSLSCDRTDRLDQANPI